MEVRYLFPYWGLEGTTAQTYVAQAIALGFGGIEINPPHDETFVAELAHAIARQRMVDPGFVFVLQHVLPPALESPAEHANRMYNRLAYLASLKPDFINAQTGKDYYLFEENCQLIDLANSIQKATGVRIIHETHRGRFSFHAMSLLRYLDAYPTLWLCGDFSHFCTVSESLLHDQAPILERIMPHVVHIHARVGHEQGPQLADPSSSYSATHLAAFEALWRKTISIQEALGTSLITITPEAGPAPYMPVDPYTNRPLADQLEVNIWMKNHLQNVL
jgi:hypothetical protein